MRSRTRLHTALAVLFSLMMVLLGWFSQQWRVQKDVTANARNSLALESIAAAEALNEPLEIVAVMTPNVALEQRIDALIQRYRSVNDQISLRFLNPDTDPATARELGANPAGELLLRSGARTHSVGQLSERSLTTAIRRLSREQDRRIVFTTGHEERAPQGKAPGDWAASCAQLSRAGLMCSTQSLVGTPVIESDVDVLIIADPKRSFFPGEVASVLDYIGRGGNVLWLSESAAREGLDLSLSPLKTELGVDFLPGTVIDQASQALEAGSPTFVVLDRFPDHLISRNLQSPVMLPEASALTLQRLAGQEFSPLLQTGAESWTETGPLQGAVQFDENTEETAGPLLLGLTLERQRPDQRTQRLAVIGEADFASNRFIGNGANFNLIESLLTWLAGDVDTLQFITRPAPDAELVLNQASIIGITATWLAAVPLVLLGLGAYFRWRR